MRLIGKEGECVSDKDNPFVSDSGFSLESILAEIKGSAFIEGDTKTPSHILEAEAERILRETGVSGSAGGAGTATVAENPEKEAAVFVKEANDLVGEPEFFNLQSEPDIEDTDELPVIVTPTEDEASPPREGRFTAERPAAPMFAEDLPSIDIPIDEKSEPRASLFDRVIVAEEEQQGDDYEEEFFEEPRLKDRAKKFARMCNSISLRLLPASIISVIMVLITFVFEAGLAVPYGIGHSLVHAAGALVILLLVVMMLCIEVIIRGTDYLISGNPNAETLIMLSCVFSLVSATFTILSGTALMLPFCAVSALSLVCASFGERSSMRAMTDTLKVAISSAEPYGVQAQYNENIDNTVLKKSYGRTDGFYTNLMQQDISENLYRYASPILLIATLLITVISVLFNRTVENSLHTLSALLAAAAPFSALLTFSLPFSIVTKNLCKEGVAIAGWGGADDIAHTDGVCVTDDDMFPQGTLALTAVKVFDGAAPNNVICYTASLIIASGSGLTSLFADVLTEKGITPLRVADFECHESGVSAVIQGHHVATGSAAYMNLIGVRVPDDSNMRNAIFTAVNNRLVAMFTVDYKPLPAVQKALISLLKWRIDLFFAMRDFNITPSMVGLKFKVPFESFVFMPVKESYSISDPYSGERGRMAAILVRESLGPYAHAITGARLLRSASVFASMISIVSAAIGVILMFLMLWGGSFLSATPGNLIIYMLCMLAAVLLVCGYVKIRK